VRANSAIDLSDLSAAEQSTEALGAMHDDNLPTATTADVPGARVPTAGVPSMQTTAISDQSQEQTTPSSKSSADLESAVPFLKLRPVEQADADRVAAPFVVPAAATDAAEAATVPHPTTNIPRSAPDKTTAAAPDVPRSTAMEAPWYRNSFLALGIVLVLIATTTTIVRRYVPSARPVPSSAMRVVGRLPVSGRQSAVLLQVGRRVLLVGVTSDRIDGLAEFTDAEEVNMLLGNTWDTEPSATEPFDATLASEFGRYPAEAGDTLHEPTRTGGVGEKFADQKIDAQDDVPVTVGGSNGGASSRTLQETKGQLQNLLTKLKSLQSSS
jgi:flagellar biogenesis protein FliO